jgi:hypothetical protein
MAQPKFRVYFECFALFPNSHKNTLWFKLFLCRFSLPHHLFDWVGSVVCVYKAATATTDCGFNNWEPFVRIMKQNLKNYAKKAA